MQRIIRAGMLSGLALALGVSVWGQDHATTMAKLPAPVRATVEAQVAQGAKLRGLSTDMENGQREYEAELTVAGKHRDIAMDATGRITEQEDAVKLASLPAAAQAALRKQGTVARVEAVSAQGKFEAYEAVVRKANGKRVEVRVDKAGQALPDNG